MSSRTAIDPLSITDGKISNQAKIAHRKLAPAKEGQILVAGSDGKFAATDFPETTSTTTTTVVEEESLPADSVKVGTEDGDNKYIKLGSGAGEIVTRDSNGNINADTAINSLNCISSEKADIATRSYTSDVTGNADKFDNKSPSHYLDVSNHTSSTSTDTNANTVTNKRTYEVIEYTPPTNYNTSNVPISFTHTMPYIPDVSVYLVGNSTNTEIDAEVTATAAVGNNTGTVQVEVSESNLDLKIVAK